MIVMQVVLVIVMIIINGHTSNSASCSNRAGRPGERESEEMQGQVLRAYTPYEIR